MKFEYLALVSKNLRTVRLESAECSGHGALVRTIEVQVAVMSRDWLLM